MFNPHIHQQQQQQQLHHHLRQLQQLFQQQPPPPPPPPPPQPAPGHHVPHHHQTPRAIPVPPQTAPPPRMVNLCQATQATIIAPNPMLQGALLMQQMQGSIRGFGMGGQQFRQFFAAGTRSSLLGPVPMGMAIKSPIMGFPAARPFHPHARFFNATSPTVSTSSSISTTDAAARQTDRKRDSDQMTAGSTNDQPAAARSTDEVSDKSQADGSVGGADGLISQEQLEEPAAKRQRTDELDEPEDQNMVENITSTPSESSSNTADTQPPGSGVQKDECSDRLSDCVEVPEEPKADEAPGCLSAQSPSSRLIEDDQEVNSPAEETSQDKDASSASPENNDEEDEAVAEGSNKFYCYLCSITCHNQQNFRSHMNSISHQQRMMEIQHMSNACLVTLLPRVQESLQGNKDGEKGTDSKHWCATCHTHFMCSVVDHCRSEEHKLASHTDLSFCAVCKTRFKTSQNFLEHLHSLEHKQKLQEKGCEALTKLSSMDTDGFSLEVEGGEEWQRNEEDKGDTQDGWSSQKERTINDITSDEQHDPDTIYGASFLDPAAGFICRLCNKFYLLESAALNTHCKSLMHFENLKRYQALEGQKASKISISPADNFQPETETTSDCSQELSLTTDTSDATNIMKPLVTVTRLKMQKEEQLEEKQEESDSAVVIPATSSPDEELSLLQEEGDPTSQVSEAQESPAEEADSEPAPAAAPAEESNGEGEDEAPAGPVKKNSTGRAKTAAKRRSGRATNRR